MRPCTQCGRCCTNPSFMGAMVATSDDIKRWKREGRDDILQYAYILGSIAETRGFSYADLWISPRTGHETERCPFVRKMPNSNAYKCRIYETRPQACRDYPWHVSHMRFVNCEMLEDGDTDEDVLAFMGHTKSAQDG